VKNKKTDTEIFKMEANCLTLKEEIQKQFDNKDYPVTIALFKTVEECYNDPIAYYMRLGYLYQLNNQGLQAREYFIKAITLIENNQVLSDNERSLALVTLYLMLNKKAIAKKEIKRINKNALSRVQQKELKGLEEMANIGEFISVSYKIEMHLFE